MPCDSKISINLEIDTTRAEVLDAAMRAIGYIPDGERKWMRLWANGSSRGISRVALSGKTLSISDTGSTPLDKIRSEILRATSREIVQNTARRNGWQLHWTTAGRAEATRATYGIGTNANTGGMGR